MKEQQKEALEELDRVSFSYSVDGFVVTSEKDFQHDPVILGQNEKSPKNPEILCVSDYADKSISEHKYRSVVWIDREKKIIYVANAGTRINVSEDLKDDLNLALGKLPAKMKSIQALNNHILSTLQKEVDSKEMSEWNFNYSGHSLGGVLSDLASVDMLLKLEKKFPEGKFTENIKSTTFDNPGSSRLVNRLIKQEKGEKEANIQLKNVKDKIKFTSFQAEPNLINTLDQQMGDVHRIVNKKDAKREFLDHVFNSGLHLLNIAVSVAILAFLAGAAFQAIPIAVGVTGAGATAVIGKKLGKAASKFSKIYGAGKSVYKHRNKINKILNEVDEKTNHLAGVSEHSLKKLRNGFEGDGCVIVVKNSKEVEQAGEVANLKNIVNYSEEMYDALVNVLETRKGAYDTWQRDKAKSNQTVYKMYPDNDFSSKGLEFTDQEYLAAHKIATGKDANIKPKTMKILDVLTSVSQVLVSINSFLAEIARV